MGDAIQKAIETLLGVMNDITGLSHDALIIKQNELDVVSPLYKYFAIVGMCMTLIYFLIEMNKKLALEGGDLTLKSFFAPFLKLVIALAVLMKGAEVAGWLISLNNTMLKDLGANTAQYIQHIGAGKKIDEIISTGDITAALSGSFFFLLFGFVGIAVSFLISLVLKAVWWYKSITWKIEMLFRVGLAPIACADIYSGSNSAAVRYFKGFLVMGIYGVALCILPAISQSIAMSGIVNAFNGGVPNFWGLFANLANLLFVAPFAALACASTVKTLAKEALGA